MTINKIISGGQTGVDRAALDAAINNNIDHGGWCPLGRIAEDGPIDSRYQLTETTSSKHAYRTECNVRDSDGTLIINMGHLAGGTALTARFAGVYDKPCLVADLNKKVDIASICNWVSSNKLQTLNVAGPRESKYNGIYKKAGKLVDEMIRQLGAV